MTSLATTPTPPYYAVIAPAVLAADVDGYPQLAQQLHETAREIDGFIGIETCYRGQFVIAISYWRTYKVPVVITNSNNIIGKNQHPEKFVPKIIELIKADKEVQIHVTKKRPGRRNYNPVDNIGDALMFILKKTKMDYAIR